MRQDKKDRNFIILIGGPGKYACEDPAHDKSWKNYIAPVQVAIQKNEIRRLKREKLHWLVYAPAYEERWKDDQSKFTRMQALQGNNNCLYKTRFEAAQYVMKKWHAQNFLNRIQGSAGALGATYTALKSPYDFWYKLARFPKGSISRVWYFGHANQMALILKLDHLPNGRGLDIQPGHCISIGDIERNRKLADRFDTTLKQISKFYGCYTRHFSREWERVFKVDAEGAFNSLDFSVIDKGPNTPLLKRLETSPINEVPPGWGGD